MRIRLIIAAGLYVLFAATALAQTTLPAEPVIEAVPGSEAAPESATGATGATGATEQVAQDTTRVDAELENLKTHINALLEEVQAGATDLARKVPGAESLSDAQIAGIALGIVTGAVAADALGGNGVATIALAAGGGVLGNWIVGQF